MTQPSEERGKHIAGLFARVANRYDFLNRLMTFGQDGRWRRVLARRAISGEERWVLDLGSGTGDLALAIRDFHPDLPIVAIDISKEMLAIAARKPESDTISWVIADVKRLPFAAATIGNTVSAFLVRNVPEIGTLFSEQFRVLLPHGSMAYLDTTPPKNLLLAPLQRFYFTHVVPLLGKIFAGDAHAYRYLAQSTMEFMDIDELSQRMVEAGFENVEGQPLSLGAVAIHSGEKKPARSLPAPQP